MENIRDTISTTAAEDLRTKIFHGITLDATGKATLAGNDEAGVGILISPGNTGDPVTIAVAGIVSLSFSDSIHPGDNVALDANGKGKPDSGNGFIIGTALEFVGAGSEGSILISQGSIKGKSGVTVGQTFLTIPHLLDASSNEAVTEYIPGFAGTITKIFLIVLDITTDTVDKTMTFNAEIETTNVTSGAITLNTLVGAIQKGFVVEAIPTATNVFTDSEKISIEVTGAAFDDGRVLIGLILEY